jgi:hypothetical protein
MSLLDRILAWINNELLSPNDSTTNWKRAVEEGKAVREEIKRLSERPKESFGATETQPQGKITTIHETTPTTKTL